MQCRHTVPDWHRYVDPSGEGPPIFVACRLLVREGEQSPDPRTIACGYWGHQQDCPLYEGPGAAARPGPNEAARPAPTDVPVVVGTAWPVRPPTARDGMRIVVMALGVVSIVLLVWTAAIWLSLMRGTAAPANFVVVASAAAVVSIVTHALATLRVWARR